MKAFHLDLTPYKKDLLVRREEGKIFIQCAIRKRWLVFQPEEVVRQLLIQHLIQSCYLKKGKISVEKGIQIQQTLKRFDLLAYDKAGEPLLLLEIKSAKEKINQAVLDQASVYNRTVGAPYLAISNGLIAYVLKLNWDTNQYIFLDSFPDFSNTRHL